MYLYFKTSFSKKGQWQYIDADFASVLFTVLPVANTIFSLLELFNNGKEKDETNDNFNNFFNVKK